ncbi:Hypothetical protein IALB_1584 [Ignavibacterium album JCM 16511]|uniref:Uncharacterized protein n=1 Tax=Ignavibacterium album (strain DSM 19864 / JCM 16511 / NBRC 101810 / Mat9-16) TaxID=945713 RepID=I0AJY5_IGNAJ|nr:hypothetical protein [Ignavibacterium album]AFH49292.1 Hypothetical protein IALB_1584 [Ignavibacterium album JCM 16511]
MQRLSLTSKIFLTIAITSGTLWLGSYSVKLFSIYNFFDLGQNNSLILKSALTNIDLKPVFFELLPVFTISLISYIVFIVFSAAFLFLSKISLKANGWLFISLMIVLICLPFEVILSLKDYKIINLIMSNSNNSPEMIEIIKSRISELSAFPIISIILHYSIFILLVFKPLTKKN